jgi:mannose-6-phosphate isomerase-like protein (cupin superfamily)
MSEDGEATRPFTKVNLRDVKDSAVAFGLSEMQEARFCGRDLGAVSTGLAHHVLKPGKRQSFGHRHADAEEVYVVLAGSGRVKLDDEIIDVGPRDAVRVAPSVLRRFEAGPEGIEFLAFGPSHPGDGEIVPDFWAE